MIRTRTLAAVLVVPALLAAGCTSSSAKHPDPSSTNSTSASATALATTLRAGINGLTSADITAKAGTILESLTGRVELKAGDVTASDLVIGAGSTASTVISVGSDSYAKLPTGQNTSGKPWIKVTDSSKNEFVRGLASTLSVVQAATSLSGIADLVGKATAVKPLGPATVGGVATTHFSLTIHGDANGSALEKLLAVTGSTGVPSEIWLDRAGRPAEVQFTIAALKITAVVTLGHFNAPLTITAPPKNEILES